MDLCEATGCLTTVTVIGISKSIETWNRKMKNRLKLFNGGIFSEPCRILYKNLYLRGLIIFLLILRKPFKCFASGARNPSLGMFPTRRNSLGEHRQNINQDGFVYPIRWRLLFDGINYFQENSYSLRPSSTHAVSLII